MARVKAPHVKAPSRSVQAFVIDTGGNVHRIASPLLAMLAPQIAEHHTLVKAQADSDGSQALREKVGLALGGTTCARRPFDFALFAYGATIDTYHKSAIYTKQLDIVGRKWSIVGDASNAKKDQITAFFRDAFGKRTFAEGMGCVWTDYEAIGNAYLEIVPDRKGVPVELVHIPATEMWVRLDELGYVQQKNGQVAHFRDFAVREEKYGSLSANDPLGKQGIHSVLHWSQYSPWSRYYGVPPILPAWNSITIRQLVAEFNLTFFGNNAIPDYAVIVEGEAGTGTVEMLQEYFRTHLKGKSHKTLIMDTPDGQKIRFEKLTSDAAKEGSFRLLKQDCRDEILHAHQMQPNKVGIVETGKLGGQVGDSQERVYKESVVDPGRERVTPRLNRIIELGFKEPNLRFEFEPYDIDDELRSAQIYEMECRNGAITSNEWRNDVYPDRDPLPGGDEPKHQPSMADIAGLEQMVADVQRTIQKAIEGEAA